MPCEHRFINDLRPNGKIKHLFIGTFNPSWDRPDGDNANWFYGRKNNDFWYIMPQVFGHHSLMEPQFRNNREFLMTWCNENQIGITDLIRNIVDADINNETHRESILSMRDNEFDKFNNIIPSDIIEIISQNRANLCGVYLTRYKHTLDDQGVIFNFWSAIENCCGEYGIHFHDLVTPSRNYRVIRRDEKLQLWLQAIRQEC